MISFASAEFAIAMGLVQAGYLWISRSGEPSCPIPESVLSTLGSTTPPKPRFSPSTVGWPFSSLNSGEMNPSTWL